MLQARRIPNETKEAQQLTTFVASLGVSNQLEVYSCNDQVYINADIVLPVLSIDIAWLHKNAETPTHYIKLKKATYINKYGMTKLLGQSKQPAAYKLQDYLYELFYRVETEGVVNRDSLVSRKRLLALTDEVDTYKTIIEKNQTAIEEARESTKAALNDLAMYEIENAKLQKYNAQLEVDLKEVNRDLDVFRGIANKLSRYVRVKSKNPPEEAYSDVLEIEDELDAQDSTIDHPTSLTIVSDAIKAKNRLKEESKGRPKVIARVVPNSSTAEKHAYYLMRTVEYVDDEQNYQWSLIDVEPSEDHLTKSEEYLTGEINDLPYQQICYRKLMF